MVTQMLKINPHKSYEILLVNCKELTKSNNAIYLLSCIESIKAAHPNANLNVLIHSSMSDFFASNPFVKNIFCIDKDDILRQLKVAKIDISLSFAASQTSTILLFRAGVKKRVGIFSKLYSVLFNYKVKKRRLDCNTHEIFSNLPLLKMLGVSELSPPKIYLSISEKTKSLEFLESRFSNFDNLLVFIPSALSGISWNFNNFLEVANALSSEYPLLICGNSKEISMYKNVLKNFSNLSDKNLFIYESFSDFADLNIENIMESSLDSISFMRLLLGIISEARLVVGNHNTLMCAASILKAQTLSIMPFIKSINPAKCAPINAFNKHSVIITPLGIYNKNEKIDATNMQIEKQGVRINSITYDLIYDIIKNKLLAP